MTTKQALPPPNELEIERSLLGFVFTRPKTFGDISAILSEGDMYEDMNRFIFQAMQQIAGRYVTIDIFSVSKELKKFKQLGKREYSGYLKQLIQESRTRIESFADHAKAIKDASLKRQMMVYFSEGLQMIYSSKPFSKIQEFAQNKPFDIGSDQSGEADGIQLHEASTRKIEQMEATAESDGGLDGISTGFHSLDQKGMTYLDGEFYIIAARPGMGKSIFATQIAENCARSGITPALFSLEMTPEQEAARVLSRRTDIRGDEIKKPKRLTEIDWAKLKRERDDQKALNYRLYDEHEMSISQFNAKAQRAVNKFGVQIIFIDYLQLMDGTKGKGKNREQEISGISRGLKKAAKRLKVPIIALSQFSRALEKRENKRPQLSDLRESGSLEQDAYGVTAIYRDKYYSPESGNEDAEIITLKDRGGGLGKVLLGFRGHVTKFVEKDAEQACLDFKGNSEETEDLPF